MKNSQVSSRKNCILVLCSKRKIVQIKYKYINYIINITGWGLNIDDLIKNKTNFAMSSREIYFTIIFLKIKISYTVKGVSESAMSSN